MQSHKNRKELGQTQLIFSYHDAERRSTVEDEENNGNRTLIHVCQHHNVTERRNPVDYDGEALNKHEGGTNKMNRIIGCHGPQ